MKTGVLFLHGFTGGPFEIRPFVKFLQEQTDWLLTTPVLPGHDFPVDLRHTSAEAWMMEAEVTLRKLRKEVDRVIVVGFSMGGLIASYLALRYPIDKLVLLSAAAKYISPRILLHDLVIMLSESVTKRYTPNSFYHLYDYKLKHTPFYATWQFLRLHKMVAPYYSIIDTPVCIVQGKRDGIVPHTAARHLYESFASKEKHLVYSEKGKHHICYSDDCEQWFQKAFHFMSR